MAPCSLLPGLNREVLRMDTQPLHIPSTSDPCPAAPSHIGQEKSKTHLQHMQVSSPKRGQLVTQRASCLIWYGMERRCQSHHAPVSAPTVWEGESLPPSPRWGTSRTAVTEHSQRSERPEAAAELGVTTWSAPVEETHLEQTAAQLAGSFTCF